MNARSRTTVLSVVSVLLAFAPLADGGTYFSHVATSILVMAIAATGLNLLVGSAGLLSLTHAAFMAIGAYGTALLTKSLATNTFLAQSGLHVAAGVIGGTILAAILGGVLAVPAIRTRGPYLAMTTIAFGWVVWKVLQEWVPVTGGDLGIASIARMRLGSIVLDERGYYVAVLLAYLAILAGNSRVLSSSLGLLIRAIRHAEPMVAASGIDVDRVKVVTFSISASIAGFAGALFAHQQSYINPDSFQVFDSVHLLLAVLLGGAGTTLGPLLGAAILVVIPEMLQGLSELLLIVFGGLLLVTVYLMPRGLLGQWREPRRGPSRRWQGGVSAAGVDCRAWVPREYEGGAVSIEALSKSFDGLPALNMAPFQVRPGTIHALIGPNGAGKTTLLNVVSCALRPDAGRVLLDGAAVTARSLSGGARRGIVRTFQNIELVGDLTVSEHVEIGMVARRGRAVSECPPGPRRDKAARSRQLEEVQELLGLLGIQRFERVLVNTLSSGHQRLVEIARALAAHPRVLLLDEPAAGLDDQDLVALTVALNGIRRLGVTVLIVEHNLDFVRRLVDEVTVLDGGRVIASGSPAETISDARVVGAYLGAIDERT